MPTIEVNIGYRPRPLQEEIHRRLKRWNVLVCHRRFGKTVLCIAELIDKALRCDLERPRFGYFAPLYRQAKQAAWDYLKSMTRDIPGTTIFESDLRVDLPNGARIQLFGSDNPDAVRGIYLDGVILDEYAQMPPRMFAEVLRPALADRKGWAIFIGTPMGRNAFCDLYESAVGDDEWYAALYKASDTGVVDEEELRQAKRHMSQDQYNQEFECSFEAAIPGAYYGQLMREAAEAGRICAVPYDPAAGVETWWDLGIGDATAIWFMQRVGMELHAIDYYEESGHGIEHYVNMLNQRAQPIAQGGCGYNYTDIVLPHDANKRSLQTGNTLADTVHNLTNTRPKVQERDVNILDGVERVRTTIPRTWFDKDKCSRGIECLRQYKEHWDDKRQAFTGVPYHDWTSHGADAFRTGCSKRETAHNWGGYTSDQMAPVLPVA